MMGLVQDAAHVNDLCMSNDGACCVECFSTIGEMHTAECETGAGIVCLSDCVITS